MIEPLPKSFSICFSALANASFLSIKVCSPPSVRFIYPLYKTPILSATSSSNFSQKTKRQENSHRFVLYFLNAQTVKPNGAERHALSCRARLCKSPCANHSVLNVKSPFAAPISTESPSFASPLMISFDKAVSTL